MNSTLAPLALGIAFAFAPPSGALARPEPTAADVAPFVDGIVETELARNDVAGAVVVVVANGAPVLMKGYGFADVAKRVPVDERTLFRPASISKLFTAIAVLQLVEQRKLDLDADVNEYLDFAVPRAFGKPATLRQLLSHRAGFEERLRGLGQPAAPAIPLAELMRGALPRRAFEPERWPSYSNYGVALAGYVVERTAGMPFEAYAAQHVFAPLGMERATFAQPLPAQLAPRISQGYQVASRPPGPFEVINDAPAGALSASGDAMARFLLMLLGGGEIGGRRVLSPEGFARFVEPQVDVAGNALGLVIYEQRPYGVRLLGHGGDLSYFHSELLFSPERGFGVFVAQNSFGNGGPMLRSVLIPALVERYFAEPARGPGRPAAGAQGDARREPVRDPSGVYMVTRRADSTLMRMLGLVGQVDVRVGEEGTLETRGLRDLASNTLRWREVAPDRFRSLDGKYEIAFEHDASGRAVRLLPPFPGLTFERAALVDTQAFALAVLAPSLAIALAALLAPVAGRIARRALAAPASPARPFFQRALAPFTAGLWLAHFGLAAAFLQKATVEFWRLSRGEDGELIAAVALAWVAAASSIATAAFALARLRDGRGTLARRLAGLLPALAFLALTWFAWHWRLLSDPTQY